MFQARDLPFAHGVVVHVKNINRRLFLELVFIHANDHILARVDARLLFSGAFFDLQFRPAVLDRLRHAAHLFDFFDNPPCLIRNVLGELFHHVAAGPGVDHVGDVGFFLDDELGVARDAG